MRSPGPSSALRRVRHRAGVLGARRVRRVLGVGATDASGADARRRARRPAVRASAATAIDFAWAQVGKRYCWGGTGPTCFDCSGLVQRAWGKPASACRGRPTPSRPSFPRCLSTKCAPGTFSGGRGTWACTRATVGWSKRSTGATAWCVAPRCARIAPFGRPAEACVRRGWVRQRRVTHALRARGLQNPARRSAKFTVVRSHGSAASSVWLEGPHRARSRAADGQGRRTAMTGRARAERRADEARCKPALVC